MHKGQNAIVYFSLIEWKDPRMIFDFVWDHIAESADLFGGCALFLLVRT